MGLGDSAPKLLFLVARGLPPAENATVGTPCCIVHKKQDGSNDAEKIDTLENLFIFPARLRGRLNMISLQASIGCIILLVPSNIYRKHCYNPPPLSLILVCLWGSKSSEQEEFQNWGNYI